MDRKHIVETSERRRPRLIALTVLLVLVAAGGYAAWTYGLTGDEGVLAGLASFADKDITTTTLFTSGALSGLFFLPVPIEAAYILGLQQGLPPVFSAVAMIAGFVLGSIISYLIGWKLSRYVQYLVSAKKLYGLRRKVNRWGGWAVLIINTIPAPSPVLTFGLGITRYNFARLFTLLLLGNTIKFGAIIAFYALT